MWFEALLDIVGGDKLGGRRWYKKRFLIPNFVVEDDVRRDYVVPKDVVEDEVRRGDVVPNVIVEDNVKRG